jgi:prepilin-type N-terminal cleavage/methylation domain-containing protein
MKITRKNGMRRPRRRGFTLVELLAVMSIMALLAGLILPSILNLFNAGADNQAYNLLTAQMMAARALAIRTSNYTAVHVQLADSNAQKGRSGDPNPGIIAGRFFMAIMELKRDPNSSTSDFMHTRFAKASGYDAVTLPGTYAFGRLTANYVNNSNYTGGALDGAASPLADNTGFTAFTIVFSPSGNVVSNFVTTHSKGAFDYGQNTMFDNVTSPTDQAPSRIWTDPAPDSVDKNGNIIPIGVTALTLFDYVKFCALPDGSARANYLNQYGQFLAINVYTGQMLPRQ